MQGRNQHIVRKSFAEAGLVDNQAIGLRVYIVIHCLSNLR